jgi:hypothetical protein
MAPSSLFLKAAALVVVGLNSRVSALAPYELVDNYQGTGFFDMWYFNSVSSVLYDVARSC